MKHKAFLCVSLLFLVCACTKENSFLTKTGISTGDSLVTTPTSVGLLTSVSQCASGYRVVDSLQYDSLGRLTAFLQYVYDSTKGSPLSSSFNTYFSYTSGSNLPNMYTQLIGGFSWSDQHKLTYDVQGRISEDTSLSGSGFVSRFSYPATGIASSLQFNETPGNNQIDTLFVTGGNVQSEHVYYPNEEGTADSLSASLQFGFTTYSNPGYISTASSAIGPLLYILAIDGYGGYSDFVSKDAVGQISGATDGLPGGSTVHITYTLDAQNRPVKAVEAYGQYTAASTTFTYSK